VKLIGGHINIYIWEICCEMEAEWEWQDLILAVSKFWDLLLDLSSGSVTMITNFNITCFPSGSYRISSQNPVHNLGSTLHVSFSSVVHVSIAI
jgi:hypothetical protein